MTFAWTINADPSFDPVVIIDLDAALQEWSNLIDGKGTLRGHPEISDQTRLL